MFALPASARFCRGVFVLLCVCATAACGPANADLHPLPTYRVAITDLTVPQPALAGTEVTISVEWKAGGAPFLVTWGFPPEFERVLVSEETSKHSARITVSLPSGNIRQDFACDVTIADPSPYRDVRSFTLTRLGTELP